MFKSGGALTDEELRELQGNEDNLSGFQSYDDYLDSQITAEDLYYLEDEELAGSWWSSGTAARVKRSSARSLSSGKGETRENSHKVNESKEFGQLRSDAVYIFAGTGKSRGAGARGQADVHRVHPDTEPCRAGSFSYIDYAHRLKMEAFEPYFQQKEVHAPPHRPILL